MKNILNNEEDLKLYHKNGKVAYAFHKTSDGYWYEITYDSNENRLTYKNSNGVRSGFDVPEFTMEELEKIVGTYFKIKR